MPPWRLRYLCSLCQSRILYANTSTYAPKSISQQMSRNLTEGVGLQLYAWSTLFLHLHSSVLYFLSNFSLCSQEIGICHTILLYSLCISGNISLLHFSINLSLNSLDTLCLISLDAVVDKLLITWATIFKCRTNANSLLESWKKDDAQTLPHSCRPGMEFELHKLFSSTLLRGMPSPWSYNDCAFETLK